MRTFQKIIMNQKFSYLIRCAVILLATFGLQALRAQVSPCLQNYRDIVTHYNQDIKIAEYEVSLQKEKMKSAKADFFPQLSADGNFSYTGNPMELTISPSNAVGHYKIKGKYMTYGGSLTFIQPIYKGGSIKAGYEKSKKEREMAENEKQRIINDIIYDADVYYWKAVAQTEVVKIAEEFKTSVNLLADVVHHRVKEGYTDRNDLLMVEVKLNDANYRLLQSQNSKEIARLSLNSFAGIDSGQTIPTDSTIPPLKQIDNYQGTIEQGMAHRPELMITMNDIDIQKSAAQIANVQFLPQFSMGIDGSYISPGYDFRTDMDPNYMIYAKISIPIFEWGKRKRTHHIGKYRINIAQEKHNKVTDNLRLEIQTAYYTYSQAIEKVLLTENSLQKADESENLAIQKYKEGNISIVEVIDAQLYHQEAKINYVQSKLNAQIAKSNFERSVGRINKLR